MSDTDTIERPEADDDHLTMGIDPWERNWMRFSVVLLVVFAIAVSVAGWAGGFQLPGAESEVDPQTVMDEGSPWANPGLVEIGDQHFEAYVLAQMWSFAPARLVVPQGAEVDIYVTSADLQHGFKITDTNINMQIVPGQVSKLTYTFDDLGEFPYICTEYCGTGHAAMFGSVEVVSQADYEAQQSADTTTDTTTDASTDESTTEADG